MVFLSSHVIFIGQGDVAKAFGAGADFVMLGGMLAGHDESAGEVIERDGKFYKMFYGYCSAICTSVFVFKELLTDAGYPLPFLLTQISLA